MPLGRVIVRSSSFNTAQRFELGYDVRIAKDAHGTWPLDGRTAAQISDDVNAQLAEAGAIVDETASLARTLRRR